MRELCVSLSLSLSLSACVSVCMCDENTDMKMRVLSGRRVGVVGGCVCLSLCLHVCIHMCDENTVKGLWVWVSWVVREVENIKIVPFISPQPQILIHMQMQGRYTCRNTSKDNHVLFYLCFW